jgi:hypothetical protein
VCAGLQEWIGLLISLSFVLPHLCIILSTQFVQVRGIPLARFDLLRVETVCLAPG